MHFGWDSVAVITAFSFVGGWVGTRAVATLAHRTLPLLVSVAACGVLAVWTFHVVYGTSAFLLSLCLGWGLLYLAIVDWLEFRLPDLLTLPLIAGGLVAAALLPADDMMDTLVGPILGHVPEHALGGHAAILFVSAEHVLEHAAIAAIAYAMLWFVAWFYHYLRGREGLGLGDAKLVAAAGAWLGLRPLPSVLLIASTAGILWILATSAIHGRKGLTQRIPFGVPLACATWIVWLYEPLAFANMQ
jgi:leader peptidase (prepilin peptidase)/N-methyltransferase